MWRYRVSLLLLFMAISAVPFLFCGNSFCFDDSYFYWNQAQVQPGGFEVGFPIHYILYIINLAIQNPVLSVRIFAIVVSGITLLLFNSIAEHFIKDGKFALMATIILAVSIPWIHIGGQFLKDLFFMFELMLFLLIYINTSSRKYETVFYLAFAVLALLTDLGSGLFFAVSILYFKFWTNHEHDWVMVVLAWIGIIIKAALAPGNLALTGTLILIILFTGMSGFIVKVMRERNDYLFNSFMVVGLWTANLMFIIDFNNVWRYIMLVWWIAIMYLMYAMLMMPKLRLIFIIIIGLQLFSYGWKLTYSHELYPLESIPQLKQMLEKEKPNTIMLPNYNYQFEFLLRQAGFQGNVVYELPCDVSVEQEVYYLNESSELHWQRCI